MNATKLRQEAIREKKCHVCGNPVCPYQTDNDYARALAEKWNGNPKNKECWISIDSATGTDGQ